jgi:fibronectin-binding autotransporter adhesin
VFDFSGTPGQFFTVAVPQAGGTNGVWALSTGGSWASGASWTGGVPQVAGDTATFGPAITGAATVTLDGSQTVGKITFNNANSYTIDVGTGGTLTIDDSTDSLGNNPAINVEAGSHTILAPVALANGVMVNTVSNTSITLKGQLSGAGDLSHTGGGNLVLTASNSFSGNITSTAGTVELDDANAASSAVITLGDPDVDNLAAALNIGSTVTSLSNAIVTNRDLADNNNLRTISASGNTALNGTISVNGGVVFAPAGGTTMTVNGVVQNGSDVSANARRGIRASGAGTVVLNNTETSSGDTYVDSGTLVLASGASLQSGSINVFTGGTFVDNGELLSTVKIYTRGTVNITGNSTAFSLPISTGTIDIDDGGSMTIGHSASTTAPVFVTAGSLEFLNNSTGKLDLTNNQLETTNDQQTVLNQIRAGNIVTSTPGGTLGYGTDGGDGETLIEFAVAGDADLSGTVDVNDFDTLAANYGQTGVFWSQGDFNYDGTVNALDFNMLATNYGKSVPASAPVAALGTAVPEPTMLSMAGLMMAGLLRRRSGLGK